MSAPTNRPASDSTYANLNGNLYRPENIDPALSEAPKPVRSELYGETLVICYAYKDGSEGFAITNGKCALHVDNNNNFIISAGSPGQSGSGGKFVVNAGDYIQKGTSFAMEITGKANNSTKNQGADGNIEDKEEPAYSLKVYGDIWIESVGGEVKIKGDNVQINANNTLNLTSGKDITLQAGGEGGTINLNGGSVNINAGFLKKKITNGEYTEGTAEVRTEQYKPGSSIITESVGNVKYQVNGDYEIGTTGDFRVGVTKNYNVSVGLDSAFQTKNQSTLVLGQSKLEVQGISKTKGTTQKETYNLTVGPAKGKDSGYVVDSFSGVTMKSTTGAFDFSVGKSLSSFKFDQKNGSFSVGKLSTLNLGPKEAALSYGKISSLKVGPTSISLTAPAIYLN